MQLIKMVFAVFFFIFLFQRCSGSFSSHTHHGLCVLNKQMMQLLSKCFRVSKCPCIPRWMNA